MGGVGMQTKGCSSNSEKVSLPQYSHHLMDRQPFKFLFHSFLFCIHFFCSAANGSAILHRKFECVGDTNTFKLPVQNLVYM